MPAIHTTVKKYIVGDNVTATLDELGTLTIRSDKGTLWNDWAERADINRRNVIKIKTEGMTYLPEDSSLLFSECRRVTDIDTSGLDASRTTNMAGMFKFCERMTSLDLSSLDTSKVTDMSDMFYWCPDLTDINFEGFNTSNVTTMKNMFSDCGVKNPDLSGFDTSNVTDMSNMFSFCYGITNLDLSSFNTSQVTDMNSKRYKHEIHVRTRRELRGHRFEQFRYIERYRHELYVQLL